MQNLKSRSSRLRERFLNVGIALLNWSHYVPYAVKKAAEKEAEIKNLPGPLYLAQASPE
jgi:hypothetical protein